MERRGFSNSLGGHLAYGPKGSFQHLICEKVCTCIAFPIRMADLHPPIARKELIYWMDYVLVLVAFHPFN